MKEEIIQKIIKEINSDLANAERIAAQLENAPNELQPAVAAWLSDQEIVLEFQGISLDMIMEKEKVAYLQAIIRMSLLMRNEELAAGYINWTPINKDVDR